VSYPKCGRTWLHLLLAKYFSLKYNEKLEKSLNHMSRSNKKIPRMVLTHDGKYLTKINRSKKIFVNKKVIFIVRDPRDVVVSHFHHNYTRDRIYKKTLSQFIRDPIFGIKKVVEYMNWWYEKRNVPFDFLLVRYEDFHKNTTGQVKQLLTFMGEKNIDGEFVEKAIDYCSIENLKELEKLGEINFKGFNYKKKHTDKNSLKARKGQVKGYIKDLSGSDLNFVNSCMKIHNKSFGYG
jgi:hypothetical protein